jgi:signal peptidase I
MKPRSSSGVVVRFLRAQLAAGQRIRLTVVTDSMRPLLHPGDYVWIEQVPHSQLLPGDVITYVWQGAIYTHRLIAHHGHVCSTKGDRAMYADPTIAPDAILGRVVAFQHSGHHPVRPTGWCWWTMGRTVTSHALFNGQWQTAFQRFRVRHLWLAPPARRLAVFVHTLYTVGIKGFWRWWLRVQPPYGIEDPPGSTELPGEYSR